jgi:hypothetical protein
MTVLATQYTSSSALRLVAIEELVSRSARFQSRVGAGNATDAKTKVYAGEITLDDVLAMLEGGTLEVARPCAIIGLQAHLYQQIGQGAGTQLGASGAAWLLLLDNAQHSDNHKLSLLDFTDWTERRARRHRATWSATTWARRTTRCGRSSPCSMFLEPLRQRPGGPQER